MKKKMQFTCNGRDVIMDFTDNLMYQMQEMALSGSRIEHATIIQY